MIAVIQRVRRASISIESEVIAGIEQGLVVLLGIAREDTRQDVLYMVNKIPRIRMFPDTEGRMNDSLLDTERELLLISQFTLLGNTAKGRRPSFDQAASSQTARVLYDEVLEKLRALKLNVQEGRFGAEMIVSLENDGPFTLILDSRSGEGVKKG